MKQASVVAERGTCLRRNYGAIIVSQSNVLISQGYCGAPRGFPHCSEYGVCFRKEKNIPSGERYELCRSVHAEQNTIINAALHGVRIPPHSKIYVYGFDAETKERGDGRPCKMCERVIVNAGIVNVFSSKPEGGILAQKVADWTWNEKKGIERKS